MEIVIRKAMLEDAYERAVCHVSSWRSAYKDIVPDEVLDNLSVEGTAEKFRRYLQESPENLFYCAAHGSKIIGHFNIGKSRGEDKLNSGEIIGFYLTEEFWGKGYGRKMMNYAVDELKNMGYNEAILWVLEDNGRARRFYEKCGFVFDGSKKEIEIGKVLIEIRYSLIL